MSAYTPLPSEFSFPIRNKRPLPPFVWGRHDSGNDSSRSPLCCKHTLLCETTSGGKSDLTQEGPTLVSVTDSPRRRNLSVWSAEKRSEGKKKAGGPSQMGARGRGQRAEPGPGLRLGWGPFCLGGSLSSSCPPLISSSTDLRPTLAKKPTWIHKAQAEVSRWAWWGLRPQKTDLLEQKEIPGDQKRHPLGRPTSWPLSGSAEVQT